MNTCPHCHKDIEEPKGYALISTDGKEQKVVDSITLAPESMKFYVHEVRRKVHAEEIPVICIMERER